MNQTQREALYTQQQESIRAAALKALFSVQQTLLTLPLGDDLVITDDFSRPVTTEKRRQKMLEEIEGNIRVLTEMPANNIDPRWGAECPAFNDDLTE